MEGRLAELRGSLRKKFTAVFDCVLGGAALFAAIIIAYLIISVTLDVCMRYFLNSPQAWVPESASYGMLFITFLGAAWVLKRGKHVNIEIVLNWLKPRDQSMLNLITSVISAFLFILITCISIWVTWDSFARNIWINSALEPPRGAILIIIPIGSFLLSIQFIRRAYNYWSSWKESKAKK